MISDLIYDVGMNNGDDTAYYLHKGFRVVAIEAHPQLCDQAGRRFASEIAAGRLTLLNIGVAATEGELPFWVCDTHSAWSSFDRSIAARDGCQHHKIAIPCRRFRSVLAEHGVPFYLKVDIEGNDLLCIQDLVPNDLPPHLSIEAGDLDQLKILQDSGYAEFKCISQYNFLPVELPPSPQQRQYERFQNLLQSRHPLVRTFRGFGGRDWMKKQANRSRTIDGWTFSNGSSGPFATDLPGRWQSYDEMRTTYAHFLDLQAAHQPSVFWNGKDYSFWSDFHARRSDA